MKQHIKALWQSTFNDTEEFVGFYFENIFTEQNSIFIEQNEQIISALQVIPFDMKMSNRIVQTAYLSGICTDKNFRNQGFMAELMHKTHNQLFAENYWAATLIPADENLEKMYQKFGYSAVFCTESTKHLTQTAQSFLANSAQYMHSLREIKISELQPVDEKNAYEYFNSKNFEREISLLADKNYFDIILKYFKIDKKKIFVAKYHENIAGMAFMSEDGKILEFFYDNETAKAALIDFIMQIFDSQKIITSFPHGMLRIINVENFLNFYAENNPEQEHKIAVFDKDIEENCANYFIKDGLATKISSKNVNYPLISVKKLSEMLLKNSQSKMTIMMNE
ncbi:MAG: GNAT family N-acetyltransferase [Prevotellaceae bacterium]|nr:GNAT family N-acetyltransferase [Prevotellaceae bacterium]